MCFNNMYIVYFKLINKKSMFGNYLHVNSHPVIRSLHLRLIKNTEYNLKTYDHHDYECID